MTPVARGLRSGVASARGPNRTHNEDAVLVGPPWFVVADGMGGHAAGEVASRIVVDTFRSADGLMCGPSTGHDDAGNLQAQIVAVVERANTAVRAEAMTRGTDGMGSTVVGLSLVDDGAQGRAVVFHVGDSRCYRLVDGELRLLTRDHSHVRELLDAGMLTSEQARHHPLRNIVTRAIGPDPQVEPCCVVLDRRPSRYLLCTDGLSGVLGPRIIGRVLAGTERPDRAAARLVELAIEAGTVDDATALVADVDPIGDNGRQGTESIGTMT